MSSFVCSQKVFQLPEKYLQAFCNILLESSFCKIFSTKVFLSCSGLFFVSHVKTQTVFGPWFCVCTLPLLFTTLTSFSCMNLALNYKFEYWIFILFYFIFCLYGTQNEFGIYQMPPWWYCMMNPNNYSAQKNVSNLDIRKSNQMSTSSSRIQNRVAKNILILPHFLMVTFWRFADALWCKQQTCLHFHRIKVFHFRSHLQTLASRPNAGHNVDTQAFKPKICWWPVIVVILWHCGCTHPLWLLCNISISQPFTELNESARCIQRSTAEDLKSWEHNLLCRSYPSAQQIGQLV